MPRRDYTQVGREYTETYGEEIEREVAGLQWTTETMLPMSPALGIREVIKQLGLPKVTATAIGGCIEVPDGPFETATYSIYGIEANYSDARIRVYVLDRGHELIPLYMDVFAGSEIAQPA